MRPAGIADETGEAVMSVDVARVGLAVVWERPEGSGLCQCAVRAMMVEVVLVLGQDRRRVAFVDDEDAVEEFAADAADKPFGDRVRAWCPNRVLITWVPTPAKTASNMVTNVVSRSRMRNRDVVRASRPPS